MLQHTRSATSVKDPFIFQMILTELTYSTVQHLYLEGMAQYAVIPVGMLLLEQSACDVSSLYHFSNDSFLSEILHLE